MPKTAKEVALALVQFAPKKGDVDDNLASVEKAFERLAGDVERFPDVVVFPEASLSGYFVEGGVRDVAMSAKKVLARLQAAARRGVGKKLKNFDLSLIHI